MNIPLIVLEDIALAIGSLAFAILFCWLCWALFKPMHHPEWGPALVLAALAFGSHGHIFGSEYERMTATMTVLLALTIWVVGREGRNEPIRSTVDEQVNEPSIVRQQAAQNGKYPAIVACMSEARPPRKAEIRRVSKRIRTEAYPDQVIDPTFRRRISHAALAALGTKVPTPTKKFEVRPQAVDQSQDKKSVDQLDSDGGINDRA